VTGTNGGLSEERRSYEPVSLHTEIDDFVHDHRPHGPLIAARHGAVYHAIRRTV